MPTQTDAHEARRLTAREQKAIADLKGLAKRWPKTLMLFSQSGDLEVLDRAGFLAGDNPGGILIDVISGIPNDGGDRDHYND